MTNLLAKGRELGYTANQVRAIIKEQQLLFSREKRIKEVLECDNLEDIKILLIDWIDKGYLE